MGTVIRPPDMHLSSSSNNFVQTLCSPQGVVTEVIYGAALYGATYIAGKDASQEEKLLWTIATLATTTLVLNLGAASLIGHVGIPIIVDTKALVNFFFCNLFGRAISIYIPLSGSETSRLPHTIKELSDASEQTVKSHYSYYTQYPQELSKLDNKQRLTLQKRCEELSLEGLQIVYTDQEKPGAWTVEDCCYVRDTEWEIPAEAQHGFDMDCFLNHLSPPDGELSEKTITFLSQHSEEEGFDPNSLSHVQVAWYKKMVDQNQDENWKRLSLKLQHLLRQNPLGFPNRMSLPQTIEEVRALPDGALDHYSNNIENYQDLPSDAVRLELIKRYVESPSFGDRVLVNPRSPLNRKLLECVPDLLKVGNLTPNMVKSLDETSVKLYTKLFGCEVAFWNNLKGSVQLAFIDHEGFSPPHNQIKLLEVDEIPSLSEKGLKTVFRLLNPNDPMSDLDYALFKRFCELSIGPPTDEMKASLKSGIGTRITDETPSPWPLDQLTAASKPDDYTEEQLKWIMAGYTHSRVDCKHLYALPLIVQYRFTQKYQEGVITLVPTLQQIRDLFNDSNITEREKREIAEELHLIFNEQLRAYNNKADKTDGDHELLEKTLTLFMLEACKMPKGLDTLHDRIKEPPRTEWDRLHVTWLEHFASKEGPNKAAWEALYARAQA